jgi:hypothetical protein
LKVIRGADWMPLSAARPLPRGGVACAVTLLLHASLAFLCFAGHRPVAGDNGEPIDRDCLVLVQPARGIFTTEPAEPPYNTTTRLRREDVEIWKYHLGHPFNSPGEPHYETLGFAQPAECVPSPLVHEVEEGETLASIARLYGSRDWRVVYRHPANRWLSRQRRDPDRIFPGDRVVIPAPANEIDCGELQESF